VVEQTPKAENFVTRFVTSPLLLTASFGHDSYNSAWISLRCDHFNEKLDKLSVIAVLMNYGCEERFALKAFSLLEISGRYDCCVQAAWIKRRHFELYSDLKAVGITLCHEKNYRSWVSCHENRRV